MERGAAAELVPDRIDNDIISACLISGISGFLYGGNEMRTGLAGSRVPAVNLKKTGENIRRMRKEVGISVRELQVIFGFTNPQAIYSWQNGSSLPTIDNLIILAAVLGTTIDEIIAVDTDEPEESEISCFYPQIKIYNSVS